MISTSYNGNFYWSAPSYRILLEDARRKISKAITRNYAVAFTNKYYVILLRRR